METTTLQQLDKYASPRSASSADSSAPFSFQLWYSSHQGVIPGQEYKQYGEYLVRWYRDANIENSSRVNRIKLNYFTLLNQLQLFIPRQDLEEWYNQVNINDEKELLLSIPYYAKKLRDIALYYQQVRESIKKAKLQYNLVGTSTSMHQGIISDILSQFTQQGITNISVPASVWNTIPSLSAVKDTINIQIEELYDFQNYLGQSPTVSASEYFDLTDQQTNDFFASRGLALSSSNWLYSTGNLDLSISTGNSNIDALQNILTRKLIGENKYNSSALLLSSNSEHFTIAIKAGNNFFYWPSGSYESIASTRKEFTPVRVNEAGITGARAGQTLQTADTIIVKSDSGIEGAWFRYIPYSESNNIMSAAFNANSRTSFRFPFPGFGLSGEDIDWTGYGLSSTKSFEYLDPEYKQAVENVYWNTATLSSTTTPIKINDTTLAISKSNASQQYELADKITVWSKPPAYNSSAYSGISQKAWLYKMLNTDIPIAANAPNIIVWPYQRVDIAAPFPSNIPTDYSACNPVALTSVYIGGGVASDTIDNADKIYKLVNYTDTIDSAVECAWLSGSTFITSSLSGVNQPGLSMVLPSGLVTRFVWQGRNNATPGELFPSINHANDCTYTLTASSTYINSDICTCRSVQFSPFGQPGTSFTDNNKLTDFIALDTQSPKNFDLNTWVGSDGSQYTSSRDFTWFQTNTNIGWGDGSWNNNNFVLQQGKSYVYSRANATNVNTPLPDLIVRYSYSNNTTQWIKSVQQNDNSWSSADTPSDMVFNCNDILNFTTVGATEFDSYNLTNTQTTITNNITSIWSDYDYVSIHQQVLVTYPYTTYTDVTALNSPDAYDQYPSVNTSMIQQYTAWSLKSPTGNTLYFYNTPSFSFAPTLTGLYTIALTALTAGATPSLSGLYYFSNIPPITAVNPVTLTVGVTSNNITVPGYVLNTPLKGWGYNSGIFDKNLTDAQPGAKPFWALAYSAKSANTKFGGIDSWGSPQKIVDGHNIVTQPDISNITLNGGEYFEYDRQYPSTITWNQPITVQTAVNDKEWCTLQISTTGIAALSKDIKNIQTDLEVIPLNTRSSLAISNYVNNKPVQVYYTAASPFTWNITAVPLVSALIFPVTSITPTIEALNPWSNITNRFYPTIATTPFLGSLSSENQFGGFFAPKYLGASFFIDKDYTITTSASGSALSGLFEDPAIHVGGRELTKQDQLTPFTVSIENNVWMKEPILSGPAAGSVRKSVAKKYQKFIPYQSNYETNSLNQMGLITPTSRQTPWGGADDQQWSDPQNQPMSFAGVVSVDTWGDSQVLKEYSKQLDSWATDIFGNQYGLYKNLSGVSVTSRHDIPGDIWTRKNSQMVDPGFISLSGVFNTYSNTFLYPQLTGSGVNKLEVFFDTLYIETSSAIFFEKIEYDYETGEIYSVADNARYISLVMPVTPTLSREFNAISYDTFNQQYSSIALPGETWFFPQKKQVITSVCGCSAFNISPELYKIDINTHQFSKVFPITQSDTSTIALLTSLSATQISRPVLSYNNTSKEYIFTIDTISVQQKKSIIEIIIQDLPVFTIKTIKVWS